MDDYNFWADLLTTYWSNPDWLKFAWLLAAAAIPICIATIIGRLLNSLFHLRQRPKHVADASIRAIAMQPGPLGNFGLYRVRADADGVPYLEQVGTVPMLDWDHPDKG